MTLEDITTNDPAVCRHIVARTFTHDSDVELLAQVADYFERNPEQCNIAGVQYEWNAQDEEAQLTVYSYGDEDEPAGGTGGVPSETRQWGDDTVPDPASKLSRRHIVDVVIYLLLTLGFGYLSGYLLDWLT